MPKKTPVQKVKRVVNTRVVLEGKGCMDQVVKAQFTRDGKTVKCTAEGNVFKFNIDDFVQAAAMLAEDVKVS